MNKSMSVLLLIAGALAAVPEANAQRMPLDGGWKLRKGDDPAWAAMDYPDSNWQDIPVGLPWNQAVGKNYHGYGWYRKKVFIPAKMKKHLSRVNDCLVLTVGKIDDSDQTYFNGRLVGYTGSMERKDEVSYSRIRKYMIPAEAVRWGQENVIAVRVADFGGMGGCYSGPFELVAGSWKDYLNTRTEVGGEGGIYGLGETVEPTITIYNQTPRQLAGKVVFRITSNDQTVYEQSREVVLGAAGDQAVAFAYKPTQPGYLFRVDFAITVNGKPGVLTDTAYFGVNEQR